MSAVICSCCEVKPKPIDWAARIATSMANAKKDCAKGKHWLGLRADLTPETRCAWEWCEFGKDY